MITPVCPRCSTSLTRRKRRDHVQYACPNAHGVAVDYDSLDDLVPAGELKAMLDTAPSAPEGGLGCSHCRGPMRVIQRERGLFDLEMDLCVRCRTAWLDTGEIHQVSVDTDKRFQLDSSAKVPLWKMAMTVAFLPVEKDADYFQRMPWMTWILIVACVVASIWGFVNPDYALANFAHYSGKPFPTNAMTSFTSFFLHGNWLHLLFNMYFLWVFGDNVEDHLGKLRFALLVLVATLAGDMLADLLDPALASIPGVGASGGISGLLAYYLIRFPYRRFVIMIAFRMVTIPVMYFGIFYLLKEMIGAFNQIGGVSSVSHLAHLGGALVGVAFAATRRNRFSNFKTSRAD